MGHGLQKDFRVINLLVGFVIFSDLASSGSHFRPAVAQESKIDLFFFRFLKIRSLTPSTCFIYPAKG